MKKLLITLTLIIAFMGSSFAQFDIKKLEGGGRLGYAKPLGSFSDHAKGGLTYNAYVGYQFTDNISAGIEYVSTIALAIDTSNILSSVFGLSSYLVRGNYKFVKDSNFVPYGSISLGAALVNGAARGTTYEGGTKLGFGAKAELGFTIKGFNLAYGFNIGGKAPIIEQDGGAVFANYHSFLIGYIYNF